MFFRNFKMWNTPKIVKKWDLFAKKVAKYQDARIFVERVNDIDFEGCSLLKIKDEIEEILRLAKIFDKTASMSIFMRSITATASDLGYENMSQWTFTEWAYHWIFSHICELKFEKEYLQIVWSFVRLQKFEKIWIRHVEYSKLSKTLQCFYDKIKFVNLVRRGIFKLESHSF